MTRGYHSTDAVILNSIVYGESDRIVTFYTKDHGKLKGIAKGALRSKKRFVGNLDPLSRVRLLFFQTGKSDLVRVEGVTLVDGFTPLKGEIERYGSACCMIELTNEMTREGMVSPAFFDILAGFLGLMDEGAGRHGRLADRRGRLDDPEILLRFFEIKLLTMMGYLPHLEGCVVCREGLNGERVFFSSEKGGVVCKACATGLKDIIPVSAGTARFFTMAAKMDIEKLGRLVPGPMSAKEGEKVLSNFIRYQLGKELKTRRFMEKVHGTLDGYL
ncbi:MAG: DNA repair protein RecO [Deltaproteobacteria bacterium]|nr:DNA repair protein RecO [Deltaproteobacteria bacterium]